MTLKAIPEKYQYLLKDETKAFLFLATVMDDGTPQNTPVWFNHDDQYILINSAKGRVKDHNMRQRPDVACLIVDPTNANRYVQIRGRVVEITEEGGVEHINRLNKKYTSRDEFSLPEGQIRVTYKILPHSVNGH